MTNATEHGLSTYVIFDDVLSDPHAYRARVLAQSFNEVPTPGGTFKGIAPPFDATLPYVINRHFPTAVPTIAFFRKSPKGQQEPNYLHSDSDMGQWSAILYLNPEPPVGDGTVFWEHKATGARSGAFDRGTARDLSQWRSWAHVHAKFNRLLIFKSDLFHSRALEANWGHGEQARLTANCFGTWCEGARA